MMKKNIKWFLIGFLVCIFLTSSIAYAAGGQMIEVFYNVKDIKIDMVSKMPENEKPFVFNGTTYVPLRYIAENLNMPVQWDAKTQTVFIGKTEEPNEVYIGNGIEYMNYQKGSIPAEFSYAYNSNKTVHDNIGNEYANYLTLSNSWVYTKENAWNYIEFPLNGQYKKFKAKVGLTDKYKNTTDKVTLTISADDKEIYKKTFEAGDFPEEIELDVTNINKIQFKAVTTGNDSLEIGLFNPRFVK